MWQKLVSWLVGLLGLVTMGKLPATVSPTPAPDPPKSVEIDAGKFEYRYFTVSGDEGLGLVYNYANKIAAEDLIKAYGCTKAINGGFYDFDSSPLGLVISDFRQLADNRPNKLFDGYLYVTREGRAGIAEKPVYANVKDEVQTGPVLVVNGREKAMTSTLRPARRMVAVEQANGQMVFMTVFVANSRLDGPALSDLAKAVLEIGEGEGWSIDRAINLDGGSASVFFDGHDLIGELQPVGSLWCVKKSNK